MIRSLAEQIQIKDEILTERLNLACELMKELEIEAWLTLSEEYNEDPLFHALTPARFPTARRLTILLLTQKKGQAENYCINLNYSELNRFYKQEYHPEKETQMEALTRILTQVNPNKIAINTSNDFAYTDGLSHGLYNKLMHSLPEELTQRFVSSDELGIRFLETRSKKEIEIYPEVMQVAIEIIEKTYSNEIIHPGKTTCRDLMNFMEEEVHRLGLEAWFEPDIDLQRKEGWFSEDTIIQPGDLIHCDFGIKYLNLCTDTQRLCYVLKDDEEEVPTELIEAMKRNNRFQDIVRETMILNRSGNDVFELSIEQAKKEGLNPTLYTHPLGFHGHAAGPTIGLYNQQERIPIQGDLLIHNNTAYALELNTKEYLPMYQREIYLYTEESILLIDNNTIFLAEGRDHIYTVK